MSLGTLLSRIFGLIRDQVLATQFPLMIKDAYVVAFRLPNLFRRLLGEGSLAASFIPVFIEELSQNGAGEAEAKTRAREFANAVYTLLLLVTSTLTALGLIFMPEVVGFLVSGQNFQGVPGKLELTINLSRIMFGFIFLVTLYAYLMSILNVYKRFFLPAAAQAVFNIVMIVVGFMPHLNFPGDQLAWGVLLGGLFQALMVALPLMRMGEMPRLTSTLWSRSVRLFFRNLVPSLIGMSILQVMTILNTMFASNLPQGTHTYFYLADRLLEFPQSLISVSLGVALLPTLSEMAARGDFEAMARTTHRHLRMLLFLSLPAAVGLFVLARPIVSVFFQYGLFDSNDVEFTAQILQVYSVMLIFTGLHRVTVPAFYAVKNTKLPAAISLFGLIVHFFLARYATDRYGISGLATATAFSAFLNLFLLLMFYRLRFGAIGLGDLLKSVVHLVPALAVMAAVGFGLEFYLRPYIGSILALAIAISLAGVSFFVVNGFLKHPDNQEVLSILKRRLRR